MSWSRQVAKGLVIHLLMELVITGVLTAVLLPFRAQIVTLNVELIYQGVVTYATGAMIAIFLAVFHSDNAGMRLLRNHPHSRTIYYIIMNDLLFVVASGAIAASQMPHTKTLSLISLAIMVVFTIGLTRMILKLVRIILP